MKDIYSHIIAFFLSFILQGLPCSHASSGGLTKMISSYKAYAHNIKKSQQPDRSLLEMFPSLLPEDRLIVLQKTQLLIWPLSTQQLRMLLDNVLSYLICLYQDKETGLTPLHRVCNNYLKAELLVSRNFSLNAQEKVFSNTPFHLMIANENTEGIENLIKLSKQYGRLEEINLRLKDKFGCNIICIAAKFRQEKIALLLLREFSPDHLDINEADNLGNTAFHYACLLGQTILVQELLQPKYAIKTHKKNKEGKTAYDLLDCKPSKIALMLKKIYIDPTRDECATKNHFYDQNRQPLPSGENPDGPFLEMKKKNKAQLISRLEKPVFNKEQYLISADGEEISLLLSDEDKFFIQQQADILTGTSLIERIGENQKLIKESIS